MNCFNTSFHHTHFIYHTGSCVFSAKCCRQCNRNAESTQQINQTLLAVTLEKPGHVLQLRDVVLPVVTVFDQQGEVVQILFAGVADVQLVELPEHNSPGAHLHLCEVDAMDRIPADESREVRGEGGESKLLAYWNVGKSTDTLLNHWDYYCIVLL